MASSTWEPPVALSRQEIQRASDEVFARPNIPLTVREDIFRIRVVEMDWDIACEIHEPAESSRIPTGADGKRVGIFLIHGGAMDHRCLRGVARLLASRWGCKVATMSFLGNLYLHNDSHDWPGDTINPDGTVRTPTWCKDSVITPDQYDVVYERSDLAKRKKYGTLIFAAAKEGTEFYYRMAGWPVAFEEGAKEMCRRHFPESGFTVYGHGHSTGGPHMNMVSQRVPNFGGIGMMENTPFGYIYSAVSGRTWNYPFTHLTIRSWRDTARYWGPEHGLEGMMRLPVLMEEILEDWGHQKHLPQMKAEGFIHFGAVEPLGEAAQATAKRLKLNTEETEVLVKRYQGLTRELSGPGAKPVPPLLLGVAEKSVDHQVGRYQKVVLPMYAAMKPAPKVRLVSYQAGTHMYYEPEPGLPVGVAAASAKLWMEAIIQGYYLSERQG